MANFSNQAFEILVSDLINDAFYGARSHRGTIAIIRQYSEVIVRKILDYSNEEYVTIGSKNIHIELKKKSNNNPILMTSINKIQEIGNKCTHTQQIENITDKCVDDCLESLFNLYAYLLIDYFEHYRFGSNLEVMRAFSILPPIIRYIVLDYLYTHQESNLHIIDKLSLATLKAFDKDQAKIWIESKKATLSKMSSVSEEGFLSLKQQLGIHLAEKIRNDSPDMYVLCMDRLNAVSALIEEKGVLYNDFEGAIDLYKEKGIIKDEGEELMKFNSIMEFLYLGRRPKQNNLLKEKHEYNILI